MSWRRIGIVARREFLATVRRREFLLVTLGLPLLYLLVGLGVTSATGSAVGEATRRDAARAHVLGWLDRSGLLDPAVLKRGDHGLTGRVCPTEEVGQAAVKAGTVRAFIVVPRSFAKDGTITLYEPEERGSVFGEGSSSGDVDYLPVLRRALLAGRVPDAIAERVIVRPEAQRLRYDPRAGTFQAPNPFQMVGRFLVPYVFSMLLLISVLFSSSYLLHGIVEEKENRVIEVLLSAVTHEELLYGKLIGLGGAGLAQLALWLSTGGALALLLVQMVHQLGGVVISPALIATGALFFLLGFAFYAALMAGIGSFGTSWRESQQISGALVFLLVLPLMAIAAILEAPDGSLARVLSFLPPTAPIGMMLRVAAGGASVTEVAVSAALLGLSALGIMRLSARLFRLSLLLYGQRPSLREVWRWLRYRPASA